MFLLISVTLVSKSQIPPFQATVLEPYPLKITVNKTTNIIFPYAIKSVDRGSVNVLAQKAKGVENILLVKANKENFSQTNLSVVTADGKLYSFLLDYINNPTAINISFLPDTINAANFDYGNKIYNAASIEQDAKTISEDKSKTDAVSDHRYGMTVSLDGIYIRSEVVFFRLEIVNKSNIDYDIDMLKFFIRDEKKAKRTASQEIEIHPIYALGNTTMIQGDRKNELVFALPKFTIPDKKYLSVQVTEKNGGRNLQLRIANRKIIKAKSLIGK
jgi:conjugative transposon TraN protein